MFECFFGMCFIEFVNCIFLNFNWLDMECFKVLYVIIFMVIFLSLVLWIVLLRLKFSNVEILIRYFLMLIWVKVIKEVGNFKKYFLLDGCDIF